MKSYLSIPPPLYAIVSFDKVMDFHDFLGKILDANIDWIQLRNKGAIPQSEFIGLAKTFLELRDSTSPLSKVMINDDPQMAKTIGADGVHLGQSDMDPLDARKILGENAIIGLSTNNIHQALSAPIDILSYLACGPVFQSNSKSGHAEPIGLDGVRQITSSVDFPFVAIGGINLGNAATVFQSGARSVAMIEEVYRNRAKLPEFKREIDASMSKFAVPTPCNL